LKYNQRQIENDTGFAAKFHKKEEIMGTIKVCEMNKDNLVLESPPNELIELVSGSQGSRIYDSKGISTTLSGEGGGMGGKTGLYTVKGMKVRRLTPTECERLQGFPDGWTEGVSETQRYRQLGNAVTVNVIASLFIRLRKSDSDFFTDKTN